MTYTPTNRPVPSDAPEDLYFNSSTLDKLVTGPAGVPVVDRAGIPRKSWATIEADNAGLAGDLANSSDPAKGAALIGYRASTVASWLDKLPEGSPGATQENYSSNVGLRYDIQEINGSTTSRGAQDFAFDEKNRHLYLTEGGILTRYALDGSSLSQPIDSTAAGGTALGHQGLSVEYVNDGSIRLWTTSSVGGRYAARVQYAAGVPVTDAEVFELFDGDNVFANSTSCTPAVSVCGKYLVAHGTVFGQVSNTKIRVFSMAELLAHGPGDCTDLWLFEFSTQNMVDANNPMQGIACDGTNIFCIAGGTGFTPDVQKRLSVFTITGDLVSQDLNVTIGRAAALLDASGTRWEPEGLDIAHGAGGTLTLFSGILSGDPGSRRFRIYGCGLGKPLQTKEVSLIGNYKGSMMAATATGRDYVGIRSRNDLTNGAGTNWYGGADSTNPGGLGDFTGGLTRRSVSATGNQLFKADAGVAPLTLDMNGSGIVTEVTRNGTTYGRLNISTTDFGVHAVNGAQIRFGTAAAGVGTATIRWRVDPDGTYLPHADATYNLASASLRVNNSFFAVAPTVTSDERSKVQIQSVQDRVLDAWERVDFAQYKIAEAVKEKGDDARWHFGVIAQRVKEAFEAEGLDPAEYGPLCHDVWDAEYEPVIGTRTVPKTVEIEREGFLYPEKIDVKEQYDTGERVLVREAGERYGIRYEEALCLEAALMRRTISRMGESK